MLKSKEFVVELKGVIVAAGYGTRFLPITKTIAKEMLPLIDKPAIEFIVKEFYDAGIKDVVIVSHRKKKALEDYFDKDPELENFLPGAGKPELLKEIEPYDMNFAFVRQRQMRGTGDALLAAAPFVGDSPFIVAFPDDLIFAEKGLSTQLKEVYLKYKKSVLATMRIEGDVSRYGVIDPLEKLDAQTNLLKGMVEKPKKGTEPSNIISIGRYLFTPKIFTHLKKLMPKSIEGEFFMTDGIEKMIEERDVVSYDFDGKRLDTGKPEGYIKAIFEYMNLNKEYKKILDDTLNEMGYKKV